LAGEFFKSNSGDHLEGGGKMPFNIHRIDPERDFVVLPIPGPGVYMLYQGEEVIYIGQSCKMLGRLGTHSTKMQFDSVRYFEVGNQRDRLALERSLIREFAPVYNNAHVPSEAEILDRNKREDRYDELEIQDIRRGRWGNRAQPDYKPEPKRRTYRFALQRILRQQAKKELLGG
jgi:hypothetical protein